MCSPTLVKFLVSETFILNLECLSANATRESVFCSRIHSTASPYQDWLSFLPEHGVTCSEILKIRRVRIFSKTQNIAAWCEAKWTNSSGKHGFESFGMVLRHLCFFRIVVFFLRDWFIGSWAKIVPFLIFGFRARPITEFSLLTKYVLEFVCL